MDFLARQKNSKVAFYSSVHQVIVVLSAILSLLLFSNQARANFQRGFFNIGFEEPVISNGAPCRVYVGDNLIEGWNTSHSPSSQGNSCPPGVHPALSPLLTGQAPIIELWKGPRDIVVGASSLGQISGREGEQFAELNAEEISTLSQDICLLEGEDIEWRYSHNGRNTRPDDIRFSLGGQPIITSSTSRTGDGSILTCHLGSCDVNSQVTVTNGNTRWADYSGSFTYSGPSGDAEVSFASLSGIGTSGNFLDDIQFRLKPVLEFEAQEYVELEGAAAPPIEVVIVGTVPAGGLNLNFTVDPASTAVIGEDFTVNGGTDTAFTLTVPAGEYERLVLEIPVTIREQDTVLQAPRFFSLLLDPNPPGDDYAVLSTDACGAEGNEFSTYTINDSPIFSGVVFEDNGVGTASAEDGVQEDLEAGLSNVAVRLLPLVGGQCDAGDVLTETQTDAQGLWQLQLPVSRIGEEVCLVTEESGFWTPVSEAIGTADPAEIDAGDPDDRTLIFTVPSSGSVWENILFGVLTFDHGDAPASYGSPNHILFDGFKLGENNDADAGPYDAVNADADLADDGVQIDGAILQGATLPVGQAEALTVAVEGAGGYLQAWIDWNQDGVFADQERIATDLQDDDDDGLIPITVNAPSAGALSGDSFARFRWSSQSALNAEGEAPDGEVEDYRITIGPVPFQCTSTLYQVATPISQLRLIDFAGSSASFVDVGPGAGQNLNAGWGYNDQDGFIHGLRSGTSELWFIDANGIFYSNGTPAGLPNGRNGSNAGDVLPDGRMIYKTGNNRLSVIDLTASPPSYQGDINLSTNLNFIDMAFNPVDGRVYMIDQSANRLAWVNLSTGQVTRFGPSIASGSYGAQWFDEDGRFYAYQNNSDSLFFFDVGVDGSGSGSQVLLATSTNSVGGINDGAFCRGEAPVPLGGVSGKVYQDVDRSDIFDNGEPGLADIEVRLYRDGGTPGNFADDVLVGSVDTDTNGDYLFPSVLGAQTYRVEVNVNDTDLPAGAALGTASPLTGILVLDESIASNNNFGFDILNIILSGWVFEDNGVGATAHDGVKGESEPGFANQTVTLFHDTDGNGECADGDPVLASDQTSGDGAFTLTVSPVDAGKDVCLVAQTPSGFLSVSESGGSLPATTGTANDDRQTFTLPAPGIAVTGLLFGDAGLPVLEPDQQGVVAAGGSRFYAHRFSARSAGIVDFVLGAAATSPANPAWSDTLYRDDNCDGALNGADETLPVTGISVTAGEQHCLLVKTFAPANAPVGALHQRPLSALQLYTGTSFQASAKVVDSTRIAAGELELEKRVQNLTAGTAGGTSNQAEPGDVLRYRLIFRNQGTSALTEVVINDSTPAFTVLNAALLCPALPLPTGLTGCAVDTPDGANVAGYKGGLEWTFTGELQPGAEGEVRYEVQVDQ